MLFKNVIQSRWNDRRVIPCRGIPSERPGPLSFKTDWSARTSTGSTIPAAAATNRLTIRSDSIAVRLIADQDSGRFEVFDVLTGVTNQEFEVSGRVVVLAASTIESIRLLLNSSSGRHPGGIGASSGVLGKYVCDHQAIGLNGTIPNSKHLPAYPSGGPNNICIPKFRNTKTPAKDFIRGYGLWGGMQRWEVERNRDARWFLTSVLEVLPYPSGCVEIDDGHTDAFGVPAVRTGIQRTETTSSE